MEEKTVILNNLYQGDHKIKMMFYNGKLIYQRIEKSQN